MTEITQSPSREIIKDFADAIRKRKIKGAKPEKAVINFRNESKDGVEREIYYVPIECLRYRKYNGRILSDVTSYEANHGILNETDIETQKIIKKFLEDKDPDKTDTLTKSIMHEGQREPAIITCDGFLINGNRRKVVFDNLYPTNHEKYGRMKVVILPGEDEAGGPPSIKEIEQIENRYQLQKDGKAEYYGFDMALSIMNKIDTGFKLEEQLRDDPKYVNLSDKEFKKITKQYEREYLRPLKCVDRYLNYLGRQHLYDSISSGPTDREGRWQAFIDYSNFYYNYLDDENWRIRNNIEDDEIGDIEDIAFKIIRKREVPNRKVHVVMRDLSKLVESQESKKALSKLIKEVEINLPDKDCVDKNGKEYTPKEIDDIWGKKYNKDFAHRINTSYSHLESEIESESPIGLLEAALNKLNHRKMDLMSLHIHDLMRATQMAEAVRNKADDLKKEAYRLHKELEKLASKG